MNSDFLEPQQKEQFIEHKSVQIFFKYEIATGSFTVVCLFLTVKFSAEMLF